MLLKIILPKKQESITKVTIRHEVNNQQEIMMDNLDKDQTQTFNEPSALFKAENKNSNEEVYCNSLQEAYEWMFSHKHWVLKKREVINWTFPLEQIVSQECWVKIE